MRGKRRGAPAAAARGSPPRQAAVKDETRVPINSDQDIVAARQLMDWGAAARALAGEKESGDRLLVKRMGSGALLAAADGLGHGAEAAKAAELAIRTAEAHALRPLPEIVEACHRVLLRTRGA